MVRFIPIFVKKHTLHTLSRFTRSSGLHPHISPIHCSSRSCAFVAFIIKAPRTESISYNNDPYGHHPPCGTRVPKHSDRPRVAQPPPPLRCLFNIIFLLCCKCLRATLINTLLTNELGFCIPAYCPFPDELALVEKPRSRHVRAAYSFRAHGPYRSVTPRAMF